MLDSPFRLDAYLERIRYTGPLSPSVETLHRLHRAQLTSIPFENLDIFLGRPIGLDPASFMTKLVDERRGGYCYELNGLFLLALQHIGFTVTPLAARVFRGETLLQKSHQLTLVEIAGERWLADVGFGSYGLMEPIPLEFEREFPQLLETFRLTADAKLGLVLQHKLSGQWHSLYTFSLEQYYPADYGMMHHYNSTSPKALFTQHVTCMLFTEDARIVLSDNELKIRRENGTSTTHLPDKDAYREVLLHTFGIALPTGVKLQSPYSSFRLSL